MPKGSFEGLLVPAITPFTAELVPDSERFVGFCRWLLSQGANGLAVFGTTSEANSLSLAQREHLLDAMINGGILASKLMPGTGACALEDAVQMTRMALDAGCGGVLVHPPFYYKPASDDGIVAFYAELIERVGDNRLKIYLYHIPQFTGVPLGRDLIGRLISAYPDTVVGLKDSGGDWTYSETMLREFPGFDVFPASEAFLLQGLRAGACGSITATGNINPAGIRELFDNWQTDRADGLQERVAEIRRIVQAYPLVPAVKVIAAHFLGEPDWRRLCPPLTTLDNEQARTLIDRLSEIQFEFAPAEKASVQTR